MSGEKHGRSTSTLAHDTAEALAVRRQEAARLEAERIRREAARLEAEAVARVRAEAEGVYRETGGAAEESLRRAARLEIDLTLLRESQRRGAADAARLGEQAAQGAAERHAKIDELQRSTERLERTIEESVTQLQAFSSAALGRLTAQADAVGRQVVSERAVDGENAASIEHRRKDLLQQIERTLVRISTDDALELESERTAIELRLKSLRGEVGSSGLVSAFSLRIEVLQHEAAHARRRAQLDSLKGLVVDRVQQLSAALDTPVLREFTRRPKSGDHPLRDTLLARLQDVERIVAGTTWASLLNDRNKLLQQLVALNRATDILVTLAQTKTERFSRLNAQIDEMPSQLERAFGEAFEEQEDASAGDAAEASPMRAVFRGQSGRIVTCEFSLDGSLGVHHRRPGESPVQFHDACAAACTTLQGLFSSLDVERRVQGEWEALPQDHLIRGEVTVLRHEAGRGTPPSEEGQ